MEINKTTTQKLDNNVQIVQATTTKPAVKTSEGTTFKDAVSMISDIDVANNSKLDTKPANAAETTNTANSTKDFQFISTTENKPSFDKTLKKENLSADEKLNIHQKAEKELVKEITLVSNKQVELKTNKNENQIAQISTAIKSDKEIETEKNDKSKLPKEHSNDSDLLDLSNNGKHQQSNLNDTNEVSNEVEINENTNISNNLKTEDDLLIGNTNSNKTDISLDFDIQKPEFTEKSSDMLEIASQQTSKKTEVINENLNIDDKSEIKDKTTTERLENKNNIDVVGSIASAEIKNSEFSKDNIVSNVTNNSDQNIIGQNSQKIKAETTEKENNLSNTENSELKNLDTKEAKTATISQDFETIASNKITNNATLPEKNNALSNNIKTFVKKEKAIKDEKIDNKKSSIISNSKIDNDSNIIKNKVATEVGEVKPVDLNKTEKPTQDMKVITFAPISPVQELKENLTTSKTNDIVKFIDANLETASSKKTSKSSSSSAKKSEEKAIKMTEADAKFFQNLVENNNQVAQDAKATDMANQSALKDVEEAHSAKVSKSLLNALKESQETNKSFRVDFDKDLSVILKVNRDGKISAEFLPGDAAVEQYLKSNIPLLKQKFNDEGLEYENLSYRDQSRKDKEEKRNRNNSNKENGYE